MDLKKFNLPKFAKTKNATPFLPTGNYHALLDDSDIQESKNGDEILRLHWILQSGRYKGCLYYSYFNLNKPLSLKVLFMMIKNMGLVPEDIENTKDLHGNECILRVKLTQHEIYGVSNIIERYLPVSELAAADLPFELILGGV